MKCLDCGRALRPHGVKAHEAPGTLYAQAGPRCDSCYRGGVSDETQRQRMPAECVECGHPLRSWRQTAEDRPGTRCHQGKGLCSSCHKTARRRNRKSPPKPEPKPEPVAVVPEPEERVYHPAVPDPALMRYFARREERLRRQARLQRVHAQKLTTTR